MQEHDYNHQNVPISSYITFSPSLAVGTVTFESGILVGMVPADVALPANTQYFKHTQLKAERPISVSYYDQYTVLSEEVGHHLNFR